MNGHRHRNDCERASERLADYAAGSLDAARRADLERHLAGCAACRDELARERALRDVLSSMPRLRCPDRVSEAILAEVEGPAAPRGRIFRFAGWRRAAAGAVAAAAALVLLLAGPLGERDTGERAWSEEEILTARAEVRYGLALAARIIGDTEKKTMGQVFGERLPDALDETMKALTTLLEGGQG